MLKKFKILIFLIALTATGIAFVLSFWLYSSYKNERELFVGTAERSLFNVLQNYYQNEFSSSEKKAELDSAEMSRRHRGLLHLMRTVYPKLDMQPLQHMLDTADFSRGRGRKPRGNAHDAESPNELLPIYLLEKMDFNKQLLDTLQPRLARALQRNGMKTNFKLSTIAIPRDVFAKYIADRKMKGDLFTRPILINPESEVFLLATFENPWPYLAVKLSGQFLFSLLLLTAVIGTFLYLLKTIRKQNQLAILRKAFVNNMTHELKTPVATVMAAVEAIQRFVAKDDKVKMHTYLELSKAELEHLNHMIERVLELDVDETHRIRLNQREFDLISLINGSLETAKISSKKDVQIMFEPNVSAMSLLADEAHIKNVLVNLLDNAIKYSADTVQIRIDVQETNRFVTIAVADKGKGIAQQHHKNIFDMFFRVSDGNIYDVKGFGLGLAYVKHVIEQHGGQIVVDSELGKGSVFTIRIPKRNTDD